MAAKSIFDVIKTDPKYTRDRSVRWFQERIRSLNVMPADRRLKNDPTRMRSSIELGWLYAFVYDPKTKDTLPYYDKFPLIIPIEMYNDGFLGINFHYLPPALRIQLLDKLYAFLSNDRMDKTTKIRATYALLKNASKYPEVRPALKRYLINHVMSRFVRITYEDWPIAVLLPAENFEKARKQQVWADSKRMARRR